MYENISDNIPAGILTSEREIVNSMEEVRIRTQFIFPGHEVLIKKYQNNHFPDICKAKRPSWGKLFSKSFTIRLGCSRRHDLRYPPWPSNQLQQSLTYKTLNSK